LYHCRRKYRIQTCGDLVAFLYNESWRSGEGKTLEWSEVDLSTNMIRLLAEKSKSKKPRHLPIMGELLEVIKRHLVVRRWIVPMFSSLRQADCLVPGKHSRRLLLKPECLPFCRTICALQRFEVSGVRD
jgi:integrase